jgi:transposase InsO family protein
MKYYNKYRPHKTLNNMTPNEFEVKYYKKSHRIVYSLKKRI